MARLGTPHPREGDLGDGDAVAQEHQAVGEQAGQGVAAQVEFESNI
jgi:hypothetical protein